MTIQDQDGVTRSQDGLTVENGVSFISGAHSVSHIQLIDQFSCGNDFAPKVRKPYTISKQRERWTDEEHKKFLEALKLYGRAWRRIEEHIGTKTAVQIRSHAQKFFSKVLRDPSGNNTSLVESVEIPPPRPKRKPVHPYPRKLVEIPNKEISNLEQLVRSSSFKSSDSDQENKSPKSVLSAVVSETLGSSDSDTPAGSLSPVSSISGVHNSSFALAEPKTSFEKHGSPPPVGLNAGSVHHERPLVKLELFYKESVPTKDGTANESSGRTLKLFGTTMWLTDTCKRPSSPTTEVCKPVPATHLTQQLQSRNSNVAIEGPATTVPWWTLSHNRQFKPLDSNLEEFESKDVRKEASWTSSNTSSVISDGENSEKLHDQVRNHVYQPFVTSSVSMRPKTYGKGFVPYKRCMSDRENQYSSITVEKREEQRIRLSL